jgi:hypothetical protein
MTVVQGVTVREVTIDADDVRIVGDGRVESVNVISGEGNVVETSGTEVTVSDGAGAVNVGGETIEPGNTGNADGQLPTESQQSATPPPGGGGGAGGGNGGGIVTPPPAQTAIENLTVDVPMPKIGERPVTAVATQTDMATFSAITWSGMKGDNQTFTFEDNPVAVLTATAREEFYFDATTWVTATESTLVNVLTGEVSSIDIEFISETAVRITVNYEALAGAPQLSATIETVGSEGNRVPAAGDELVVTVTFDGANLATSTTLWTVDVVVADDDSWISALDGQEIEVAPDGTIDTAKNTIILNIDSNTDLARSGIVSFNIEGLGADGTDLSASVTVYQAGVIESVDLVMEAPVEGGVPQDAKAINLANAGAPWTVLDISWAALDNDGIFESGEVTATITLRTDRWHRFVVEIVTISIVNGDDNGDDNGIAGTSSDGETLIFKVTFEITD